MLPKRCGSVSGCGWNYSLVYKATFMIVTYWARCAERPTTPCLQHLSGSRTPAVPAPQLRPWIGSRLTAAPGTRAGSRTREAARAGSGTSRAAVAINGQTRGEVKSRGFLPGIYFVSIIRNPRSCKDIRKGYRASTKSSSCWFSIRICFFKSPEGVCTDDL